MHVYPSVETMLCPCLSVDAVFSGSGVSPWFVARCPFVLVSGLLHVFRSPHVFVCGLIRVFLCPVNLWFDSCVSWSC